MSFLSTLNARKTIIIIIILRSSGSLSRKRVNAGFGTCFIRTRSGARV
jgi:hypothetical protein